MTRSGLETHNLGLDYKGLRLVTYVTVTLFHLCSVWMCQWCDFTKLIHLLLFNLISRTIFQKYVRSGTTTGLDLWSEDVRDTGAGWTEQTSAQPQRKRNHEAEQTERTARWLSLFWCVCVCMCVCVCVQVLGWRSAWQLGHAGGRRGLRAASLLWETHTEAVEWRRL